MVFEILWGARAKFNYSVRKFFSFERFSCVRFGSLGHGHGRFGESRSPIEEISRIAKLVEKVDCEWLCDTRDSHQQWRGTKKGFPQISRIFLTKGSSGSSARFRN